MSSQPPLVQRQSLNQVVDSLADGKYNNIREITQLVIDSGIWGPDPIARWGWEEAENKVRGAFQTIVDPANGERKYHNTLIEDTNGQLTIQCYVQESLFGVSEYTQAVRAYRRSWHHAQSEALKLDTRCFKRYGVHVLPDQDRQIPLPSGP